MESFQPGPLFAGNERTTRGVASGTAEASLAVTPDTTTDPNNPASATETIAVPFMPPFLCEQSPPVGMSSPGSPPSRRAAEPLLEPRRADAGALAGGEALI